MNNILNLIIESINENEKVYSEILYKDENIINLKIKIKWLSEELLEYYLVIEKDKKDKVKIREIKGKNKLPLLCPERHINSGGYFCLGYENIDNLSIINKETACKFVNRLVVYLKLQRKAEVLGSWDLDKSWSHGNSANEHKKILELAKEMGDFFLKSINEDNVIVLSSYNKKITHITNEEFEKIKFLKLKFKDSKKEYTINKLTRKVTNLKQNCICGSGKKMKKCSNHSKYLYDFCLYYALMKRKEEEFWISINENNINPCCGFSSKCKIKKLEKGDKKMDELESKKLENLRWILDKQLGWISASETKATTFIAFNITSFTVLSYFFEIKSINEFKCEYILPIIAVICGLFALYKIISVFIPRTDIKGTSENISDSYLYFNLIDKNKKDYNNKVKNQTYEDLENDLINQICINAQIANIKHDLIKDSIKPTFINFSLTIISILFSILMKLL